MGVVFRQSVKSTLAVGAGAGLGVVINLIAPYLVPVSQLGFSRNLINQTTILHYVVLLGAGNTFSILLQRYPKDDPRRRGMLAAGFLVPLAALLLFTLFYSQLQRFIVPLYQPHDQPLVQAFYPLLPGLLAIYCLQNLLDGFMLSEKKTALLLFNREVVLRIAMLVLLLLYGKALISFPAFMWGHLVAYGIPVIFLFLLARKGGNLQFGLAPKTISKDTWKEWAHFSWYHMLMGLALNLVGFLDALLLPALNAGGLQSLAVYTTSLFVAAVVTIPYKAMSSATLPVLNEAYIAGDTEHTRNLFDRSALNILLATVPLLLLILVNLPFLQWILPPKYAGVGMLTAILLIGRFVEVSTGLNSEMLSISNQYKFMFRLSAALVGMLLLLGFALIPTWGATGAAWSASIAFVLYNVAKVVRLYRRQGLFPFRQSTMKVLLAGACVIPVFFLPAMGHPLLNLTLRSIAVLLIYGVAIFRLRPSPDVEHYLKETIRRGKLF